MLHALFLGFVFGMIFGPAPVIFPAVLGRPIAYGPRFDGHVLLLHASPALQVIVVRPGRADLRRWGGMLNVGGRAPLPFLVVTALSLNRPDEPMRGL